MKTGEDIEGASENHLTSTLPLFEAEGNSWLLTAGSHCGMTRSVLGKGDVSEHNTQLLSWITYLIWERKKF